MAGTFDGKVALVTGASSGIGLATAQAFARAGARVVLSDLDVEQGEAAARSITQEGGTAKFIACDVSDGAAVAALIQGTVRAYGRLDCAFNNAGISGAQAPTGEYPEEAWNRVIAVNLTGVWLCMKHEITQMLAQGGGAIVNCASILGHVGFATAPAYVAAKHGVVGLTKTAAIEYATRGIRVNAVCPGFIETPMLSRAGLTTNAQMRATIEGLHPMKRLGRADEIAAATLFLASPAASFITGQSLLADGGYIAQ